MVDKIDKQERKTIFGLTHSSINLNLMTLSELKREVDSLMEQYGPEARFEETTFEYETSVHMYLYAPRLENDKEYEKRIKDEAELAAMREKQERAEYERLSKKFNP